MTICIGAIAENSKIITVTDKMLTLTNPTMTTKYEMSENNKAIDIHKKVAALFAGDVIHGNVILSSVREKLKDSTDCPDITAVANMINDAYKERWKYVIESNLLSRYGLTIDLFMANHSRLDPDLVKRVDNILGEFNLLVDVVVAGIDTKPHLFMISNPGTITAYDSIGYACVGSGSQHATLSLVESEYHSNISLSKGIYALLEAKKRAEFDPGVGSLCDVCIIESGFSKVSNEKVKALMKTHAKSRSEINKIKRKSSKIMSRLLS